MALASYGSSVGAGQSQPPQHLSMFLEVSDGQSSGNSSCFVSHRLAIVNQRDTSRSLVKESQVKTLPLPHLTSPLPCCPTLQAIVNERDASRSPIEESQVRALMRVYDDVQVSCLSYVDSMLV